MDEINSLIFHGCKLARDLESNMNVPNFANQPNILSKSCDEIIRILGAARDRLNSQGSTSHAPPHDFQMPELVGGGVQEWLIRYGSTQAMSLLQWPESRVAGMERRELGLPFPGHEVGGRGMESSMQFRGGGGEVQARDDSDSGGGSSSRRPRRRRDDVNRRTVRQPAPQIGNTEIPPDDGFTWRKYGQKEILGSRFPRSYYRCTHQKLYHCPAKKLVQRLDNDPFIFEVTYRGNHTCHMSSTAPSVPPPSTGIMPPMTQPARTTQSPPPPTSVPLGRWLSMDMSGAGTSSGSSMVGGGGAGPSTVRYGINVDYQLPVTDLADVMFNSGSSSTNSMDLIFSSMEDKWEQGNKKN